MKRSISLAGLFFAAGLLLTTSVTAQTVGNTPCGVEREVEGGLLSPQMFERLTDAFELIGEEQYTEAYSDLTDMLDRRMSEYETASVEQALGFAAAQLERYPQAIQHLRNAITLDVMPNNQHFEMILQVAQLLHVVEDYDEALLQLDYWFCVSTEDAQKVAEVWVLKASLHIQQDDFREALAAIDQAIEISEDPKENWYRIKLGMHMELKEFQPAVDTLKILLDFDSNRKDYWLQLAGSYLELNDNTEAMAALRLAYRKDLLDRSSEFLQLAGLLQEQSSPRQAAEVLQDGLERGVVESTSRNWEMVAGAWFEAREMEESLAAYDQAGALSDSGRLDFQRASILTNMEDWENVVPSATRALDKGGLTDTQVGNAHLLVGMAQFNMGNLDAAEEAFRRAQDFNRVRDAANEWLNHISSTRQRMANS
ncbi:MAG: hypothetical protein AAGH65_09875 [Pseudomonadota bacterium]